MHVFDEKKAVQIFGEDIPLEKPETKIEDEDTNIFENRLVVIDNLLARASTKWTLEETKIFLLSVSLIDTMNEKHEVCLPKKDVRDMLGIDVRNATKLKETIKKISEKSWIEFTGPRSDQWSAGFVIYNGRSDDQNLYLAFNPHYVPLVKELKSHFTKFGVDDILGFSHKGALNLYMYLTSWFDDRYPHQSQSIKKSDIKRIFGLKDGQYWRNYGTESARFDWSAFEKRVLLPAIEQINDLRDCDLCVEDWHKEKDGKAVLGYHFRYCYQDKRTGMIAWRGLNGKLTGEN